MHTIHHAWHNLTIYEVPTICVRYYTYTGVHITDTTGGTPVYRPAKSVTIPAYCAAHAVH